MTPAVEAVVQAAIDQAQKIYDTAASKPDVAPLVAAQKKAKAAVDDLFVELQLAQQDLQEATVKLNAVIGSDAINALQIIHTIQGVLK